MITQIYNLPNYKNLRRQLRNNFTRAEFLLWRYLKNSQMGGYKFRRQHGIGPFIVDFFCPRAGLVIEVDGATHSSPSEKEYDKNREDYLRKLKLKIIRFNNAEVYQTPDVVLQKIALVLGVPTTPSPLLVEKLEEGVARAIQGDLS
jgi:very-short-patch-repair endonuclease